MVEKTKEHTTEIYYSYDMFQEELKRLRGHFKTTRKKYSSIYALPRGGLILGVHLSHILDIPMVKNVQDRNTLIVDDICDTGSTLEEFPHNDKIVLIGKTKGCKKINRMIVPLIVTDKTWVRFYWEEN